MLQGGFPRPVAHLGHAGLVGGEFGIEFGELDVEGVDVCVGGGDGGGEGRSGRFVFGTEEAIHGGWSGRRLLGYRGASDAESSVEVENPIVWVSRVSACGDGIDAKPAPVGCFDPL